MGQLTWQNIETNFGGGSSDSRRGGGLLAESFDPLREALASIEKKQADKHAAGEIGRALAVDDPDLLVEGMRQGAFDVTPQNYEFFADRVNHLLTERSTRQGMAKTAQEMKFAEEDQIAGAKTRALSDRGLDLTNQTTSTNLAKTKREIELAEQRISLAPQVAGEIATFKQMAYAGKLDEALAGISTPEFAAKMTNSGLKPEDIERVRDDVIDQVRSAQEVEKNNYAASIERANRPFLAKKKEFENAAEIDKFEQAEKNAVGANAKADETRRLEAEDLAAQKAAAAAFPEIRKGAGGGSLQGLLEAADSFPGLNDKARGYLKASIADVMSSYANKTPEAVKDQMYLDNPDTPQGPSTAGEGYTREAGNLVKLLGRYEGADDYKTLYGHSQKEGGVFGGRDVTQMTIGDLDRFANEGGYKAWVASQNGGVEASPFGRYQIVNSTLQDAARALHLDPNTRFDEATQDRIFQYLVNNRIGGRGSIESKIAGLRQEWTGLNKVDDATLKQAIEEFQGVSMGGLEGAMKVVDEDYGENATKALDRILAKPTLDARDVGTLIDTTNAYDRQADIVKDALRARDIFSGQTGPLLAAMQDPANTTKKITDVEKDLKDEYGDITGAQMTSEINRIVTKFDVAPGVAEAFLQAAPKEAWWFDFTADDRKIDQDKVDAMFSEYYDINVKDVSKRSRGALEKMQKVRMESASSNTVAALQTQLRDLTTEAANIIDRKRKGQAPGADEKKVIRHIKMIQERLDDELEHLDRSVTQPPEEQANPPPPPQPQNFFQFPSLFGN